MELSPDDIRALREMKAWLRTNGQKASVPARQTNRAPRVIVVAVPDSSSSGSQGSSVCVGIPGVDLDALEIVNAADVDYVLAVKNGCLVKVALTQCDASGSV